MPIIRLVRYYSVGLMMLCTSTLLLSACVGRTYIVHTHSMEPLLYETDRVVVQSIELSELERGDVVLYAEPYSPEELQLHRIIGFPGEIIAIENGILLIDGVELVEEYAVNPIPAENQYGPITLGVDEYFLLGDNRPASADSRFSRPNPSRIAPR